MNPIDDQLNRLFRVAAQADTESTPIPPYGLETRIMAAWRTAPVFSFWDMRLLIRGLIVAALIMAVSLWPTLHETTTTNPFSEYLQLADTDTTVQIDNSP